MKLTVLGCGDAFGSGGRLQTCFHVATQGRSFLIDCGATALIGMQKAGLEPNGVGTILISHLHGDHFSGIVWWLLHAVHAAKRRSPLEIAGPRGIEQRVRSAVDVLFPGALGKELPFALTFIEQTAGQRQIVGDMLVTAYEVSHPSGAPAHALRIERAGRVLAFSGDTEWVNGLVECASQADLFICECYGFEGPTRYHMNWATLAGKLPGLSARRVMLTHMNAAMLAQTAVVRTSGILLAEDGLIIEV